MKHHPPRSIPGLWGHRAMTPFEQRFYASLCAHIARLSARAEALYRLERLEPDRWCDDGGPDR